MKRIFGEINGGGEQSREDARENSGDEASAQRRDTDEGSVRRHGEERSAAENIPAGGSRCAARRRHRNQAARFPFEQQQFHRQQDGGTWER